MHNFNPGLCRIRLFPPEMHNFNLGLCRIRLFPPEMHNFNPGLCRILAFPPEMQNPLPKLCKTENIPRHFLSPERSSVSIHFPQAHTPHPCEVFLLYKRSLLFKTKRKTAKPVLYQDIFRRFFIRLFYFPLCFL